MGKFPSKIPPLHRWYNHSTSLSFLFPRNFYLVISWSNHLISSRRSIQVFYGCILLPHKRHLVVLVILGTYNSHLQIQNKCRLNKMSQVWCRKGSLWKVRFIFEITNISICAAWRVVVRLVVSIFSTLHSCSQFCPTCQVEESLSSCSSPFSPLFFLSNCWFYFLPTARSPSHVASLPSPWSSFHFPPQLVLHSFSFALLFFGFSLHFSDFFGVIQ